MKSNWCIIIGFGFTAILFIIALMGDLFYKGDKVMSGRDK